MKRELSVISIVIIMLASSGCSSIKSIPGAEKNAKGLAYYMPKKDFVLTITTDENSVLSKVEISTSKAYPDLKTKYVLNHSTNMLGKNKLDIGVSEEGLLSSASSTTVSNVSEAFQNITSSIAIRNSIKSASKATETSTCAPNMEHVFIFDAEPTEKYCGLSVKLTKLQPQAVKNKDEEAEAEAKLKFDKKFMKPGESYSGIYYRQSEPYEIEVWGSGLFASSIVFSPSKSDINFLPISKTFFANNDAKFTFVEGIPTKYIQNTDGEIVALLKLPADIIGAYFTAIGTIFDSFSTKDTKESAYLVTSLKLELQKQKYEACIKAIEAKDNELIKSLECK